MGFVAGIWPAMTHSAGVDAFLLGPFVWEWFMSAEKMPVASRPVAGEPFGLGRGGLGEIPYGLPGRELANGTFAGLGVARPGDAGRPPEGSVVPDPGVVDRGVCVDGGEVVG